MDDGHLRVRGVGGVALELGGQEERRLDLLVERDASLHQVDVADHRDRQAQVPTCSAHTTVRPLKTQLRLGEGPADRWEGPADRGKHTGGRGQQTDGRSKHIGGKGQQTNGRGKYMSGRGQQTDRRGKHMSGRGQQTNGRSNHTGGRGEHCSGRG